jgi:hypothetical protein
MVSKSVSPPPSPNHARTWAASSPSAAGCFPAGSRLARGMREAQYAVPWVKPTILHQERDKHGGRVPVLTGHG